MRVLLHVCASRVVHISCEALCAYSCLFCLFSQSLSSPFLLLLFSPSVSSASRLSITTYLSSSVVWFAQLQTKVRFCPVLSHITTHSGASPLSPHTPLGHRRASTAQLRLSPSVSLTLISHPDNIVIGIDLGLWLLWIRHNLPDLCAHRKVDSPMPTKSSSGPRIIQYPIDCHKHQQHSTNTKH